MGELPERAERSWWLREALADDPGEPCPPLAGLTHADVVILGGGYTGMWTAYFLKERDPGLDVVILEQDICGGGPSGRNGGFLNGWWSGFSEIVRRLGDDAGVRTCEAAARTVSEIGEWCERHGVDAWFTQGGDLAVASSPVQEGRWCRNLAEADRLGMAHHYVELLADEVRKRCDSPVFGGGVFTVDAATVQPARLARGLRRVLLEQGVRIYEGSPVLRFRGGRPAEAQTPGGAVRAEHAVIAVNSWGVNWRAFRPYLAVRGSYIALTAPAPERLEEIGWTGGEAIWDFRASLHYVRTTPDGRIAFGCAGMQPGSARRIGPRFAYDEHFLRKVVRDLHRMFPGFRDVPVEAGWGGPIDVSGRHLPFIGTMGNGANVHYGLGFTGNGVGPCRLAGQILSRLARDLDDELTRLPIVERRPMRFPPEPFLSPGMLVVNEAIRHKDDTEDQGRRPNPVVEFVARLPRRIGYNLGP